MVIVDTSGRLQVDEALMAELVRIRAAAAPDEVLLVADAMTGQNAVEIAREFDAKVALTGVILTKFDSDTRGGAALSVKSITGKPIKFVGVSEKLDGLEPFHPERIASRILGMGDVVTLVEKAQETMEAGEAEQLQEKLASETFTLEDMLDQYRRMRKMGSLQSIMEMIPGLKGSGAEEKIDEKGMKREEAIILSMTLPERQELPDHRPGQAGADCPRERHLGVRGEQVLEKIREDVSHDEEDVEELEISGPGAVAARRRGRRRTPVSVRIRLKRFGTKKRPFYRIVVMDSRTPRDGRVLEEIGLYHPIEKQEKQVVRQRGEGEGLAGPRSHAVEHGQAAPEPQRQR